MHLDAEFIIDIGIIIIFVLIFLCFSIGFFIYQYNRKFRARLFDFEKRRDLFLFVGFMVFLFTGSLLAPGEYYSMNKNYKEIIKTGTPTKGTVIRKSIWRSGTDIDLKIIF
jgi:amino acid permease